VRVPEELLYQLVKTEGPENADEAIHKIFKTGLTAWSEKMYQEVFGSQENLETFIELLKKKNTINPAYLTPVQAFSPRNQKKVSVIV
jgi:hypothetical protein